MNKAMKIKHIPCGAAVLLIALFSATALRAGDILERTISVHFDKTPLKEALAEISRQGGFQWTYNAGILDEGRRVTHVADGATVREVLLDMLGDAYTFKQNGDYLILKKRKKPVRQMGGYISDRETGQRMANVTVYDRQSLRSVVTDKNGYYEIPVTEGSEIVVSRLAYRDTLLRVNQQTPRLVKLELYTDSLPKSATPSFRETMDRMAVRMEQFWVGSSQKLSTLNVRDSLHRYVQVSLLPGIGTNQRLSGSVTNDWSFNILAGYSRSNRIFEIAGLGNINREDVSGLQSAGLFNIVGGNVTGLQMAGLFNNQGGNLTGLQSAGVYNYTGGAVKGVQFGGVLNIAAQGRGAVQAAGVLNLVPKGEASVQFSGVFNHAHIASAFQAAGVVNSADSLRGCQVSGVFNRAGYVRGAQIGLINFAREVHGVQIGLINYSRHGGYMVLEAGTNDVLPANAAFKSGVPALYTILSAGTDPEGASDRRLWAYGIGIGSRVAVSNWFGLSFDLLHRHLNEGAHADFVQEWEQLAVMPDIKLGKHLSIAGGPSVNLLITDPDRASATSIRDRIVTRDLLDSSNNADGWLSAWWGWNAALRVRF